MLLIWLICGADGAVLGVEADGDEEQYREGQKGGTTVGEHRQGNTNHGHKADGHTNIDKDVEQEDARNAVAIYPAEGLILAFAHLHQADNQRGEEQQHNQRAHKAPLLTHGAEDKVGALFGDEIILRLGALQEAFTEEASGADSDFRLVYVIAPTFQVALKAEEVEDAFLLVELEHVVEDIVNCSNEEQRAHKHRRKEVYVCQLVAVGVGEGNDEHNRRGN